jgi:hypothetical protein
MGAFDTSESSFKTFFSNWFDRVLLSCWRWLLNSGYTNTPALPRDLFDKYVLSIPGALWDDSWLSLNPSGSVSKYMLKIPSSSVAEMEDLCFTAKDVRWCLCPEAQLVPDGLITDGEPGYRYGYVSPIQKRVNQEAQFICKFSCLIYKALLKQINNSILLPPLVAVGMKAMERFYVAFDLANYRVSRQISLQSLPQKISRASQLTVPAYLLNCSFRSDLLRPNGRALHSKADRNR